MFTSKPMKKKKMIFFCNTAWPKKLLESGEKWPPNGSLNYNAIIQLDSFCKREKKWDEIPYVDSFMSLYKRRNMHKAFIDKMMGQREEPHKKPVLPESKSNDDLVPPSAPFAVARQSALPSVAPPSAPLVVPANPKGDLPAGSAKAFTNPPRAADPALYSPLADGHKGMVSPACTLQGIQFGPGNTLP